MAEYQNGRIKMYYYRASKYFRSTDPDTAPGSLPQVFDEWISIYDVGTVYNGTKLTMTEYERVETEYINFVVDVLEGSGINEVKIAYIEPGKKRCWRKNKTLNIESVRQFIRDCMREYCWGQITAKDFIWEPGYDYYMHIGTELSLADMQKIAQKRHLFIEVWEEVAVAPYE